MMARLKKINKLHWVCIVLCLVSAAFLIFRYQFPWNRFLQSLKDTWESAKLWFAFCFEDIVSKIGIEVYAEPTILDPVNLKWKDQLSFDFDLVYWKLMNYGDALVSIRNLTAFGEKLALFLFNASRFLLIGFPLFILIPILVDAYFYTPNKRGDCYESKPVKLLKLAARCLIFPFVGFLKRLREFLNLEYKDKKGRKKALPYKSLLKIFWFINLNIATIFFEFIAFYFYFVVLLVVNPGMVFSGEMFVIFVKLLIDAMIMFSGAPMIFWICVGWYFFDQHRQKKGFEILRHDHAKNCGLVKELPMLNLVVGAPGTRKTTMLTALALLKAMVYRVEALDIIFKYDLMFPYYPVLKLERALQEQIDSHGCYSIPSVKQWVRKLEAEGEYFGYDHVTYGTEYNDGLTVKTLWDALETYCEAYFVYLVGTYIIANYSIRTDDLKDNEENAFPLWDMDPFKRDPKKIQDQSRYAHILDQDVLRLGKRIVENNPNAGSFGFGIWVHCEWGKSYPNKDGVEGLKKDSEETNQKNDGYPYSLMMGRHAQALIDNRVFNSFFFDEQRAMSVPAKHRDMVSVISILEAPGFEIEMPSFILEDMLYHWLYEPCKKIYFKIRNKRKDEFLGVYLLRHAVSGLSRYYRYYYNLFGASEMQLLLEDGTCYGQNGKGSQVEPVIKTFKLQSKLIYSDRFASDSHASVFEKAQLEAGIGINDYRCYESLRKTVDEMKEEHDYFNMELFKMFGMMEREDPRTDLQEDLEFTLDDLDCLNVEKTEAEDPLEDNLFDLI